MIGLTTFLFTHHEMYFLPSLNLIYLVMIVHTHVPRFKKGFQKLPRVCTVHIGLEM